MLGLLSGMAQRRARSRSLMITHKFREVRRSATR